MIKFCSLIDVIFSCYFHLDEFNSYFQRAVNNVPALSNPGLNILLWALKGEKISLLSPAQGSVERCHGTHYLFHFHFHLRLLIQSNFHICFKAYCKMKLSEICRKYSKVRERKQGSASLRSPTWRRTWTDSVETSVLACLCFLVLCRWPLDRTVLFIDTRKCLFCCWEAKRW